MPSIETSSTSSSSSTRSSRPPRRAALHTSGSMTGSSICSPFEGCSPRRNVTLRDAARRLPPDPQRPSQWRRARRRAVRARAPAAESAARDPRVGRRARRSGRRRARPRAGHGQPGATAPDAVSPPVTAVIPVRDRSVARLLEALDVAEVIVVDDASPTATIRARRTRPARATCAARPAAERARRATTAWRRRARPRRVHRLRLRARSPAGSSRCCPLRRPGAGRCGAADRRAGERGRAREAAGGGGEGGGRGARARRGRRRDSAARGLAAGPARSPLRALTRRSTADPRPRARRPRRPRAVRPRRGARRPPPSALRRDPAAAARTWSSCGACRTSATSRRPRSRTTTAPTHPRFRRRVYYGRTAAASPTATRGKARPLNVSPWTTAAWAALAARRPEDRPAVTPGGTALRPRPCEREDRGGTRRARHLHFGGVLADALTRAWWPL